MGWEYIKSIQASGREVDPGDLPPALDWEAPAWQLYTRLQTQWRIGFGGPTGLDYSPAIALIQSMGWPLRLGLDLLRAIEHGFLEAWKAQGGD